MNPSKLPPLATNQVDFVRDIKPIIERSCLRCHGPERPKSRFRLDNRESALKGGEENDDDVVSGHSEKSKLIYYVARLVPDLEMPPKGKGDPLTEREISLLRAWIDQGVAWEPAGPAGGPNLSMAPTVGGIFVSGNSQQFREHFWRREHWDAGVEQFSITDRIGKDTRAELSGRGLRDDYRIFLGFDKRDVGFTRFGFEEYRKYYDDTGGYFPGFTPSTFSLNRDLYLDQGKGWVDFGLTVPDWPKFTVGYEYQFRRGEKSTLQWGPVQTAAGEQRNIYPASKSIDEHIHILKFDLAHDWAGYHFENNFRGEFFDLKTERQNTAAFSLDDPSVFYKDKAKESYNYFQGANTLRVEKPFTDWLFGSAGYLYSQLNADATFQLDTLLAPEVPSAGRGIVLGQETHAFNVAGLFGPFAGLNLSLGVLSEFTHQDGLGEADQQITDLSSGFPILTTYLVSLDASQNKSMVEESVALRYSSIPFTSLFAEARLRQESIGQFEESMGGPTEFLRQTDASSDWRDFRFGFNTSPWRRVSLSAHYRIAERDTDYHHHRDQSSNALVGIDLNGAGYSAFITDRDVDTDEIESRLVFRPAAWVKTTLTYKYITTRYATATDPASFGADDATPGGWAPPAHLRAHFGSVNATFNPWQRWLFSGTFSYQRSQIEAFDNGVPQVVPYRGDIYSVLASATFLLNKETDLQATYAFSLADYGQNNFADGLPVGMEYSRHAVTGGITRRLAKLLSARLQYGFYNFDEPSSSGANNYTAHAVFGTLVFHLQ